MPNLFSAVTSKIFGATTVLLLLALPLLWVIKAEQIKQVQKQLDAANATIARNVVDLNTLRGNNTGLEQGLAACNTSVDSYKDVVNKLAKAGEAALAEVRKNAAGVNAKLSALDKLPAKTCGDAAAILAAGGK